MPSRNYWAWFKPDGSITKSGVNGYTYSSGLGHVAISFASVSINSGTNIVGLLSTPEFTDVTNFAPINSLFNGGLSNHVVAYVRSLSGPGGRKTAAEQRHYCGRFLLPTASCASMRRWARDTNALAFNVPYDTQLADSLRELRLTFFWPQLPNGSLGKGRQTFRTLVAGQMTQTFTNNLWLYFYQSQSFTKRRHRPVKNK